MGETPTGGEYLAVGIIEFDDDTFSAQVYHRGERDSCDETARLISALAYSGKKRVVSGKMCVMSVSQWDELRTLA